MKVKTIRIIKASSADRESLLPQRIQELAAGGFKILFDDMIPDLECPWNAGALSTRVNALTKALLEPDSDAVMWARGGYGASDLLPYLPWDQIKTASTKPIIGFSDACAAQSAAYTICNQLSIHGPMPATSTWKAAGAHDVEALMKILNGQVTYGFIPVTSGSNSLASTTIDGKLFGGCLSVLTSLIGTPYLPASLNGHILFFEDIGENNGRVVRFLNQWHQSGHFVGVKAIVFGPFVDSVKTDHGENDQAPGLAKLAHSRYGIPTYVSKSFGHVAPNMPLVIGAQGRLTHETLTWSIP